MRYLVTFEMSGDMLMGDIRNELGRMQCSYNAAVKEAASESGMKLAPMKISKVRVDVLDSNRIKTRAHNRYPYADVQVLIPTRELFEKWAKEGGWKSARHFEVSTSTTVDELLGKWFCVVGGRVYA